MGIQNKNLIYTYPEIAVQNPAIQQHFPHIPQFEENFEPEIELMLDQPVQPQRRGRRQGNRNRQDSWKNLAAPGWKPKSKFEPNQDPDSISTRSKQNVDQIFSIAPAHVISTDESSSNFNWWSIVDYRRAQSKRASNPVQAKRGVCSGRKFSPRAHSNRSEQNFPSGGQSNHKN